MTDKTTELEKRIQKLEAEMADLKKRVQILSTSNAEIRQHSRMDVIQR